MSDIDFEADAAAIAPSQEQLSSISDMVLKQLALEGEVAELEEQLKSKKEELRRIAEGKLPEAITLAGTSLWKSTDGVKVEVKEDLSMSIPKSRQTECNDWLRANEMGDLLQPTITIPLLKGQDNLAGALCEHLEKEGFTYTRAEVANTTSVKAAFKKRMEAGKDVPLELFGGHKVRKAVITLPKG